MSEPSEREAAGQAEPAEQQPSAAAPTRREADAPLPAEPAPGSPITALRALIDGVDDRILDLLEERAALATSIAKEKSQIAVSMHDPEREQQIFARLEGRLRARQPHAFPVSAVHSVFREVVSACLSVGEQLSVAYLGPAGTFSHMAARGAFGMAARYVEASTIAGVFDAVARKSAKYGIVPIENSTEGGVTFTLDSLLASTLLIRNEIVLDVAPCLVARHADLTRIERVYSHPQPLAQCRLWLAKHLPQAQLVVSLSTSAAAREPLVDDAAAAITSRLAAELNDLVVVRDNIQDYEQNATRFVVLATEDAPPTGRDRTTLVFSTPDTRGALRAVLTIFDEEGINLTRIESRPRRTALWEYVFFTDLEGHRLDANVARALSRLAARCETVKVLGSYPRAS